MPTLRTTPVGEHAVAFIAAELVRCGALDPDEAAATADVDQVLMPAAIARLWDLAGQRDRLIGFRVGAATATVAAFAIARRHVMAAPSLVEACVDLCRRRPQTTRGLGLVFVADAWGARLEIDVVERSLLHDRSAEHLATMQQRLLAGHPDAGSVDFEIHLRHGEPTDAARASAAAQVTGVAVRFGSSFDGVAMAERSSSMHGHQPGIVVAVRHAVRAELSRRQRPTLAAVASRLALHPKTLARRLAERSTTFSADADDEMRRRAERLLAGGLGVEQAAAQLGYSDATAFTRAFRRWSGTAPSRFRDVRDAGTRQAGVRNGQVSAPDRPGVG